MSGVLVGEGCGAGAHRRVATGAIGWPPQRGALCLVPQNHRQDCVCHHRQDCLCYAYTMWLSFLSPEGKLPIRAPITSSAKVK
jgi:hypothetical protein